MVRTAGVEPAQPRGRGILSPLRLPVSPRPLLFNINTLFWQASSAQSVCRRCVGKSTRIAVIAQLVLEIDSAALEHRGKRRYALASSAMALALREPERWKRATGGTHVQMAARVASGSRLFQ
jgi:hypothetical protein